jgi:hypothetical protein
MNEQERCIDCGIWLDDGVFGRQCGLCYEIATHQAKQTAAQQAQALNAARYEWLRTHSWVDVSLIKSVLNFGPGYLQTKPEVLDAAIDAEIAKGLT